MVTRRQVADRGSSPIAAALPTGLAAVAVPRGDHPLPLRRGDLVEVLLLDPDSGAAEPIDDAAPVLTVNQDVAVVAVAPDLVPDIAAAALAATVSLALVN